MGYITAEGMYALDHYKYVSGGYSPFDNFMNPFWEFCVTLLPMWLAPNLVTAIGTIACVITHALFVWYSPSFDSPVPGWLNILTAFAVLFYNTMDSIDGKQARRTKASSPLGQLFDHGCDGLQTLNITLQLVSCLRLGGSMTALLFVCSVQVPFFLAQWEEYHTHSIRTNLGWFGVTEGQYITATLFLITPFLPGDNFWNSEAYAGFAWNQVLCGTFMMAPAWATASFLKKTLTEAANPGTALVQLIPISVSLGCLWSLVAMDNMDGFASTVAAYPRLSLTVFMLLNVHLITVIIVVNLAKQPYHAWRMELVPAILLVANAATNAVVLPTQVALWLVLAFTTLTYLNFVSDVINTICEHRNINCFSLGPRHPDRAKSE